jgi:hypothetical protein
MCAQETVVEMTGESTWRHAPAFGWTPVEAVEACHIGPRFSLQRFELRTCLSINMLKATSAGVCCRSSLRLWEVAEP